MRLPVSMLTPPLILSLAACAGSQQCRTVTPATASQQAATLDRVKSLAGTWEMTDDKGQKETASVFAVTSGGTAVREVMFPGTDHEMTNMYTMDGPDLVMTHYCAMGNQPHMRARAVAGAADSTRVAFQPDGVSNRTADQAFYMGQMSIVFTDSDHIRQEWRAVGDHPQQQHNPDFELTRKK